MAQLATIARNRKSYRINFINCIVDHNSRETRDKKGQLIRQILSHGSVHTAIKGYLDQSSGKFVIISGRGRYECVKELIQQDWDNLAQYDITQSDFEGIDLEALAMIPAENYPMPESKDDWARLLVQEVTDNDSESFKPIEVAKICKRLIDEYGWSFTQIAKELGRSSASVGSLLKLLETPQELQEMIADGTVAAVNVTTMLQAGESAEDVTELVKTAKAQSTTGRVKPKDLKAAKALQQTTQQRKPMTASTARPYVPTPPPSRMVHEKPTVTLAELTRGVKDLLCEIDSVTEPEKTETMVTITVEYDALIALAELIGWDLNVK